DGRAALFHPSDLLRLYPSLNSYHDDPLFQGLGTLVESAPLEGYSLLQDCGDAPGASPLLHTPFVDNHHHLGLRPLTNHPSQSRPATSMRGHTTTTPTGQHNSKPHGPIQTGTNNPHFHTGCQHLSRPPFTLP
ncbi:hypothetical protein BGY98DRAFT_995797, partial [Russula aff. rugulosa BPL654]